MPKFGPVRRNDLIAAFRDLGFTGPYAGAKHAFMQRGRLRVRIPNQDIDDVALLNKILKQAGITRAEWEAVEPIIIHATRRQAGRGLHLSVVAGRQLVQADTVLLPPRSRT